MLSRFNLAKSAAKKYCSPNVLKDKLTRGRLDVVRLKDGFTPPRLKALAGVFAQHRGAKEPKPDRTEAPRRWDLPADLLLRIRRGCNVMAASTVLVKTSADLPIPEPPAAPLPLTDEASFESLGLGGWGPVGLVQSALEYLHVSLDVPWWGAIAVGTLAVRLLMFPLVVLAQRNGAKMNNHMPQLQVLQLKMSEARQTGNQLEAARYGQEMMQFMKDKQLNPLKNLLVPLAQMPLFVSFFVGLRQMANCPVDSLRTGGALWFTDLTLPDQYFLLPIITSATMYLTIEIGTDSARLSAQNLQLMKYVLRALPLVILPFTVNFPGAILCYWTCSNFISLAQVGVLRIPRVRDYFKIEPMLQHDPDRLPMKPKGFVKGMRDSWTNMKITNELEGRRRFDEMQFQRAGKGPVLKTYKLDPTKQPARK